MSAEISSKYNPQEVENKIYSFWIEKGYFNAEVDEEKPAFSVVIPPPNVTGILHMGHALNTIIQDVLVRFKRMQGYQALWLPGTDHAGIATQNVVEKELAKEGLKKEDIGREKFLERLWEWNHRYGATILHQLKRLGASCDWRRTRFTMDKDYCVAVNKVFLELYRKGLIYRGNYIINWCPRCKTALSDEEVVHKEIDGFLYYIRYPIEGFSLQIPPRKEISYIVVATTRPETMLGDTAIAINPKDERYKWLKKVKVILPIMKRELKVIEDSVVDMKFGTGVVKVTPAHDSVDFVLGKKYNLEFINIMNEDATMNKNAGDFSGMDRFTARQMLVKILAEKGLLEKKEPYKLNVGHCYRCDTIVEPRLSQQWFVKMKPLAKPAIKIVEEGKIRFYPPRWKKVYLNWMNNIEDWCISRQIWWGHRLPVWECKCQEKEGEQEIKRFIVAKEKPKARCPHCREEYQQVSDVLDTWFSSWLWPFVTLGWPFEEESDKEKQKKKLAEFNYFYPTTLLVTASEILFFWVARMIMAGLEFVNKPPFKDVYIHGTVRDERGIKMSKSLGNIIDPLEVIEKWGTDALRFSLMLLASGGSDVYLSEEKFLVGRNFANKLWNAARFILARKGIKEIKEEKLEVDSLGIIDRWILNKLNNTIKKVANLLEAYRINEATKDIYEFFWHSFCDWYIEIVKQRERVSTTKVLVYCLLNSLKLLHPLMPFITEKIFQLIRSIAEVELEESIMISPWAKPIPIKIEKEEEEAVIYTIEMIKGIRNLKTDLGIPPNQKIKIFINSQESLKRLIIGEGREEEPWAHWICRLAGLENIEYKENLSRVLYHNPYVEVDFSLPEIDKKQFFSRIDKQIKKLENLVNKVSAKLNNKNFVNNAPPELVEKEKEKFQIFSSQIKRLNNLKTLLL